MSPVDLLARAVANFPDNIAYQIPKTSSSDDGLEEWTPVTYKEMDDDVDRYAKYWSFVLGKDGIKKRDTVVLWMEGHAYYEVIHLYALIKAGYIPQCISSRLPDVNTVYKLASRSGAKALLYLPSVAIPEDCPIVTHEVHNLSPDDVTIISTDQTETVQTSLDDVIVIYHTSGSTGDLPKLVRMTERWAMTTAKNYAEASKMSEGSGTRIWVGSIAHAGQFLAANGAILKGNCIVQPTHFPYTASHFISMVRKCHVDVLPSWSPFLPPILREARENPEVLSALQGLDFILISGSTPSAGDMEWARQNGLKIMNLFGLTEIGPLAHTVLAEGGGQEAHLFRFIEGIGAKLVPVENSHGSQSGDVVLLEAVVSCDSPIFPGSEFGSPTDGHLYTGDLFEEIKPRRYVYRGRTDDWINMGNGSRCDTKFIEDHIHSTCADLVTECVVVGAGRICPAVFVERNPSYKDGDVMMKKEIVLRLKEFNARRYTNERIHDERLILVVEKGELPRTVIKGNVRRKAVEQTYTEVLDRMYVGISL
ncbi:hypothetical protein QCA50_005226 [Cerrena zonata]|uniref:AMP-dependent synthetase/ligase domain-containing protein n=1 Tax=Cerrena zonata TaxID=2478898 RepID=A0AAW0GGT3_9APHY